MAVVLFCNDAESQHPGWSQHVNYSLTVVNQTDDKCNVVGGPTSHTFKAGALAAGGNIKALKGTVRNDIRSPTPLMGYVVNDTLIIQCDMTNVSTAAAAAAATTADAPQRETHSVEADTAAAAAIAAAYPGALPAIAAALPAVAAAIAAANPGAVPGTAPRVAVPAGLYPTGAGGLLYLPLGALANY